MRKTRNPAASRRPWRVATGALALAASCLLAGAASASLPEETDFILVTGVVCNLDTSCVALGTTNSAQYAPGSFPLTLGTPVGDLVPIEIVGLSIPDVAGLAPGVHFTIDVNTPATGVLDLASGAVDLDPIDVTITLHDELIPPPAPTLDVTLNPTTGDVVRPFCSGIGGDVISGADLDFDDGTLVMIDSVCLPAPNPIGVSGRFSLVLSAIVLAFGDDDGDTVPDVYDNCPDDPNPGQEDEDEDGKGDLCDDPCDDGLDNDSDGYFDVADPGCKDVNGPTESPECQDGIDNADPDGQIDFDGGVSIWGFALTAPDPDCVNRPWHGSEAPASVCGLGPELAVLLPALLALRRRLSRAR